MHVRALSRLFVVTLQWSMNSPKIGLMIIRYHQDHQHSSALGSRHPYRFEDQSMLQSSVQFVRLPFVPVLRIHLS